MRTKDASKTLKNWSSPTDHTRIVVLFPTVKEINLDCPACFERLEVIEVIVSHLRDVCCLYRKGTCDREAADFLGFHLGMPGCDMIGELPESLLTQILSYLPTKHSVKTSVLSTRWKNLWLNVPGLDIDCSDFPYKEDEMLLSFIDRFLEFKPESCLKKFRVKGRGETIDGLMDRIETAINRGAQHLDVESSTYSFVEFMPFNLYTSRTLVSLKLSFSGLEDPGVVCMPCLKFMTLVGVHFRDSVNLEKLISGCLVLEELTLLRNMNTDHEFMRVKSGSLKRFLFPLRRVGYCSSRVKATLEIDAPGLEHMILKEDHFDSIVVKNLTSLVLVDLNIKFVVRFSVYFDPEDLSKINEIRDFLTGISNVRHMIISEETVKAFDLYSKVGPIPKFNNLSRLEAVFSSELLRFLPAFLECCPNLKYLILKVAYSETMEILKLIDVPWCLLSTLECVEIKRIYEWDEPKMKVATYFLENSAVLKKLILSLTPYPRCVPESEIYEEVNKLRKRSPRCQIILDWELW